MTSSTYQSQPNNTTQDANLTMDHNSNDSAEDDGNDGSQDDVLNQHAPVATCPRPIASALNPIQHIHYESLPALNLNHPPFYGTYRDSTDGVPQYHPFSDDDEDDDNDEEEGESGDHFSQTQRLDHAYSDRPDREGQQRDEEESDSGGSRRRSRWERRRGAIMRMRTAMIWIVVLPLLLVALWVCINMFRKGKGSWETSKR